MSHMDDGMLHTHLDGELDPAGEARLREHLATCADCRSRLDLARATRTRAHEILRQADPLVIEQPDFSTVLARRAAPVAKVDPARRRPAVRPLLLPWAASLVLAVGAGWFAQSLLTGGGPGGGAERVATMQREEAEMAPAADAVSPEVGQPARVFSTEAYEAGPAPSPESPLAAVAPDADDPESTTSPSEAPPSAGRDAGVGAAGAGPETPARLRGGGADLSRAAQAEEAVVTEGVVTGAEGDRRLSDSRAAMQAAAPPPPPEAAPAGWPSAWKASDAAEAARTLGEVPVLIAALRVEAYQVSADGSGAVRVLQRLPGGELLELLQRRRLGKAGYDSATAPPDVEILIRASVSPDSLRRLREGVR